MQKPNAFLQYITASNWRHTSRSTTGYSNRTAMMATPVWNHPQHQIRDHAHESTGSISPNTCVLSHRAWRDLWGKSIPIIPGLFSIEVEVRIPESLTRSPHQSSYATWPLHLRWIDNSSDRSKFPDSFVNLLEAGEDDEAYSTRW